MKNGGLAEPGQRLLARVADTLVVGLPVVLVARSPLLGLPRETADLAAVLGVAGLLLVYETVQLALWGRTLGKRLAGIQVVRAGEPAARAGGEQAGRAGGEPVVRTGRETAQVIGAEPGPGGLGLPRALLRAATYALPLAARPVPVLGIVAGLFWVANAAALFEGTLRQALHDRLAGTVVTRRQVGPARSAGPV